MTESWQTLSYVTWKRTSLPVPKGSKICNVTAAIMAQTKLLTALDDEMAQDLFYLLHITFPEAMWAQWICEKSAQQWQTFAGKK
jgi:hypothetical protein